MRISLLFFCIAIAIIGCAGDVSNPISNQNVNPPQDSLQSLDNLETSYQGPQHLWGEWSLHFNEAHDDVLAIPKRQAGLHLNSTKFLEEYCTDCLEITQMKNNGDETIDLTIQITHPFNGHPEYTGFDVKGIIMFNGSLELEWASADIYPFYDPFYISYRAFGDPEVLNPDGYSPRWSPWWDSGSNLPIFNYYEGKYTMGIPSANLNAFKKFYTLEERHVFHVGGQVERTYKIYLPPGPVIAGYAIEACWEPPITTPVTDPLVDFPETANQREPYHFEFVINNNNVITEEPCCGSIDASDCSNLKFEYLQWYGQESTNLTARFWDRELSYGSGGGFLECDPPVPPPDVLSRGVYPAQITDWFDDGIYRGVAVILYLGPPDYWDGIPETVAYDIFDYTIDKD